MNFPHLEALHSIRDVPYIEQAGPRSNKEAILEAYGFTKGATPPDVTLIDYGDSTPKTDTRTLLHTSVLDGKYSALLFRDGAWESMGGCRVAYIMNPADVDARLRFDSNGVIVGAVSDGETFEPRDTTKLNIYTRPHSATRILEGFDNYANAVEVSYGGGFRLQIDSLVTTPEGSSLEISAHFSFNDFGSRVLAKRTAEDMTIPMATRRFRFPINDGAIDFSLESSPGTTNSTDDAIDNVVAKLLHKDGDAIRLLLNDLLTVRPVSTVHQFEGIYGVNNAGEVSVEVIDFDGIDTFDLRDSSSTAYSEKERLLGAQMIHAGLLATTDNGARVIYAQYKHKLRDTINDLRGAGVLSEGILVLASIGADEDLNTYLRRVEPNARFARVIKAAMPYILPSADEVVSTLRTANHETVSFVRICGFDLCFIENAEGNPQPITPQNLRTIAKNISNNKILNLHFQMAREGD